MAKRMPTFFPQRVNMHVPRKSYVGNIEGDSIVYADLGAPAAADNTGILNAVSINAAIDVTTFNATLVQTVAQMGRFGRNVRIVLSGAGTPTVTIYGRDFLGQRMVETLTGNGTTGVFSLKAFRYIDRITSGLVASTTLSVGLGTSLGLPYKLHNLIAEYKDGAPAANAGTVVAGLANGTTSTATTADPRGTYLPVTQVMDGTRTFALRYITDHNNVDGNKHYAG